MNKVFGLILASGTGERAGLDIPKQFFKVADKMLIEHSVDAFENNENITNIIIVSHPDYVEFVEKIVAKNNYKKVDKVVAGGKKRQESSYIGISLIPPNTKVLIHDAVRPFISQRIINDCVKALDNYKAVGVAIPCSDTIIKVDENNFIEDIPKRKNLMQIQTPQAFLSDTIKEAHEILKNKHEIIVTDDCGLIKNLNLCEIFVVKGDVKNVKITYPKDLALAEELYKMKD